MTTMRKATRKLVPGIALLAALSGQALAADGTAQAPEAVVKAPTQPVGTQQVETQTAGSPGAQAQKTDAAISPDEVAKYITAGNPFQNWLFLFGPENSPTMRLKLTGHFRNGDMGFACDTSGKLEMALDIAGVHVPAGEKTKFHISVGGEGHDVHATSVRETPHEVKTVFSIDEADAMGVLTAISTLAPVASTNLITVSYLGRELHVPNPEPMDMAVAAHRMCVNWHNAASMKALGIKPKPVMEAPSSGLHTPQPR